MTHAALARATRCPARARVGLRRVRQLGPAAVLAALGDQGVRRLRYCRNVDDAVLVEGIHNGDESCWQELVNRHAGLVWRVARSVVNDDDAATDAMQTAWLRLLENIDNLAEPGAVKAWLCTTARREAIALSKKRSSSPFMHTR